MKNPMKMEQTECSQKLPRRKHSTFRTRQKFKIKNLSLFFAVFNVHVFSGLVNYRMFREVMLNVRIKS